MGMTRGTGGNRFVAANAGIPEVMRVIHEGLYELRDWAADTGGTFDLAAITVDTRRIPSGLISVTVSADLTPTPDASSAHVPDERGPR